MFPKAVGEMLGVALAVLLIPLAASGEEFHLKDGTKLVGKIVGYEKDAFRVETSFGFALVYKNRIERIVFPGESAPSPGPAKGNQRLAPPEPATVASRPVETPPPAHPIVEQVSGTQYLNQTYRFQIYKPPTWRSFPHLVTPKNALVAALGTPDESTLLLVGSESYTGDLPGYAQIAETGLQRLYQDYRNLGEEPSEVAGLPALERRFSGVAEGRFWSGTAIYFARGRQHFTLLGLTSAGDNTSFQQAVLRKVFNTLAFLP